MASTAPKSRLRSERLEARVTLEQKQLIEYAAALKGASVTDFLLSSVQDAARKAIEDHQILALTRSDSEILVRELLSPTPASDRLKDTIRRYKEKSATFDAIAGGGSAAD